MKGLRDGPGARRGGLKSVREIERDYLLSFFSSCLPALKRTAVFALILMASPV